MMLETLILIICLIFSILAWQKPKLAVAIIVFGLFSYLIRFDLLGIPFTLLESMIWLLFIIWLIKNFKSLTVRFAKKENTGKKIITTYNLPILLLLLISVVAIEISPDTISALGIWKAYFLEPILFFLVFINVIEDKKDLKNIFYALGWSAIFISALAIYQKFTGWAIPNEFWATKETRRVTSFFGYPNAIGLYLGPIIILYFGQLLDFLKQQKNNGIVFSLLVVIVSLLAVIFAVSEGALVGIFVGLIFLNLFYSKKTRVLTMLVLIILIVISLMIPAFSQNSREELTFQGVSGKIRLEMWQETWLMLKDSPIFGAGLAGYQTSFDPYHQARHIEVYLYPHNIIFNFWSELGLAGLLLFLYLGYQFFRQGIKLFKQERILSLTLMALMITIIIHGLVDVPYFKNDLAVMFWLWLGIMFVLRRGGRVVEGAALEKL